MLTPRINTAAPAIAQFRRWSHEQASLLGVLLLTAILYGAALSPNGYANTL